MVRSFIEKINSSWKVKRSRKIFFLAAFFLLLGGIMLFKAPALAQPATAEQPNLPGMTVSFVPDFVIDLFSKIMLALTRLALSIMLFIVTFVIQVAGYNGFLDSPAVTVGWVMVRDLTNMFFVIVLLMIAFGTILGMEHYEWKHLLPKLVMAAILVNFSRIICGLIIDVSQVVMLTFVNGIAATAGGNFIRAFSLESIRSFSETASTQINSEGIFLAAVASLFISVTIMVAVGIMLFMLVGRVIALWILIVLSPIAFVFSVLEKTEHYAAEWWHKFNANVITGPVLAFFLWLTLVTVGSGTINNHMAERSAVPESNKITAASDASATIGKATSWDNLVNFIIAVAMLVGGIKIASELGGVGAEWTEHAVDYGKKVAGTVSGLYAARAAAHKTAEVAHEGIELVKEHTPIIGKAAIEDYKTVVKGKATELYANTRKKIDKYAIEKRKDAKEEGGTWNHAKSIVANTFLASRKLKHKRAGVYEEGGEIATERWETALGTSEMKQAEKNLVAGQLSEIEKEAKKAGKEKKISDKVHDLMLGSGKDSEAYMKAFKSITENKPRTQDNHEIHHHEEAEMIAKNRMGWDTPVYLGGKTFLKKTGAAAEDLLAEFDNLHANYEFDSDPQKAKEQREKLEKEKNDLLRKFNSGQEVTVGGVHLEVDHTQKSLKDANADVDYAKEHNLISSKRADELKERLKYQNRQAEMAHLEKVSTQLNEFVHRGSELQGAHTEEHLRDHDTAYQARAERISGFGAEISQIQDKLNTQKQLDLLKEIRNLLANERQGQVYALKAENEQKQMENAALQKIEIARQRDAFLMGQKRYGEATNFQRELDAQAKVQAEIQSVGDYVLAMERIKEQADRVLELRNKQPNSDELIRAEMTLMDMYTANAGRHAAFAAGADEALFEKLGIKPSRSMELTPEAIMRRQADDLAVILLEKVEASENGLKEGLRKLKERFVRQFGIKDADDRMQAYLEMRRGKMENAAGQGAAGYAGLWNVAYVDGKQKTTLTDVVKDPVKGIKHVRSRRISATSGSRLTNVTGGFWESVDKRDGKAVVESDQSVDIVVKLISPIKANQLERVEDYPKLTLADIFENTELGVIDPVTRKPYLEKLFDKLQEKTDGNALAELLADIRDRITDPARKQMIENEIQRALNKGRGKKKGQVGGGGDNP